MLLLVASSGTGIVNALDGGMTGRAGIVYGVAGLGSRCLGRAQLCGQVGIGLGDRGDRGAVELFLRGLGQKVDGILGGNHGALGKNGLVDLVEAGVLGVRSADLGIARAYKGKHAWHATQILREVLARKCAAVMALARGAQALEHGLAATLTRGGIVFDLVVGDSVIGKLGLGAQGCRGVLHDAAHKLGHLLMCLVAIGAYRTGEVGRTGDNVARRAAVQLADGDDGGLVGADLARDDGLQGVDDFGGNHNGIVAALGHGAMARGAADVDAEPVGVCHARAGLAAHGAGVDFAPDVRGIGAVDAVEHAGADHELGALAVFLAGLEYDADLAVNVIGHVTQNLQRAEHHGDVAVVAAGMHTAIVDAGELLAGLLGDRQGVDVGAQQDAAARRAVLAVGIGRGSAKGRHQARLERTLVGDIHGVELVGDVRSRALLGKAQLRVFMEVPALFDDVGFKLGGDIMDGRGDVVCRANLGCRHYLLCLGLRHGRFAPCWLDRKIVQASSSMPPATWRGKVAVCRLGFCNKSGGVHSGVLNFLPEMGMPMQHIDRIVRSKNVFTARDAIDTARELAIAIAGDRIVAVGTPDDVIAVAPAATPVVDYGEQFICPGFHDAHLHFFHTSVGSSPYMLMDMGTSEAALVQHALEFSQGLPDDAWVVTQGWRDYRWDPPEHPTKASLDAAFPDRPCVMYSGDGHTLWLNSRALEALGVTRDSEPPAGGSYDKDANGELTGIAHEAAAMQLLPRCLEWLGEDRIASAYADQMKRMAEQGITSICDMSLMPMPGCDFIRDDVYDKLQAAGKLGIRAHLFPTLLDDQSRLEELQTRYANNALLSAPGFKQFFDGVSSEHTAYLTEPYTNPRFPGDQGRLTVPAERMRKLVLAAAERGHTVRIHVIGDGAIRAALDIFEEAAELYGLPQHGHNTLEHLENLLPEDIDRLRKLNVIASSQPCHITLDPGGPERDLGLERSRIMWPFATYKKRGIRQAFGTDSPITAVTSMNVLYTAITRQDPRSHWPEGGWLPSERIDAATALRNYTLGSAYAAGDEQNLGSLEPGKYADLVVLDQNPLTIDPQELQATKVQATYLAGNLIYER